MVTKNWYDLSALTKPIDQKYTPIDWWSQKTSGISVTTPMAPINKLPVEQVPSATATSVPTGTQWAGSIWTPITPKWTTTPSQNTESSVRAWQMDPSTGRLAWTAPDSYLNQSNPTQSAPTQATQTPASTDLWTQLNTSQYNAQTNVDIVDSAKIMEEKAKQEAYMTSQNETRKAMDAINAQNQGIKDSQILRDTGNKLSQLKNNTAYLGSLWKPWQSSIALDAAQKQIADSEQIFRELVQMVDNQATANKLWIQYNARAFEESMRGLQTQLDSKVGTAMQKVINEFMKESGNIDTLAEVNAVREKYLQMADNDISVVVRANLLEKQNLMNEYKQLLEDKKTEIANKNTVNKEMSAAQWMYVDGNWQPMISLTTGQPIMIPPEAPLEPVYKDGVLVTFSLWENGEIIGTPQQVIQEPTFAQETYANLARAVANGTMTADQALEAVPKAGREAFIAQLATVQKYQEPWKARVPSRKQDANGNRYDENSSVSPWQQTWSNTTVQDDPQSIVDFSINKRWTVNLQCGQLVNDYILQTTGVDPSWSSRFWDKYTDKITAAEKLGIVDWPVVGGIFVSNPLNNNTWHTGIVQSINYDDGSITVLEANASGNKAGEPPVLKTYPITDWMVFSQAPQSKWLDPISKYNSLKSWDKTRVDKIVSSFESDPMIKKFNQQLEAKRYIDWFNINTSNPADDQSLIYAFAKMMDPDSVVREGEYATVQKYNQTWLSNFWFNAARVVDNAQVLTKSARENMIKTMNSRYTSWEQWYKNFKSEKAKQIDKVLWWWWESLLIDYTWDIGAQQQTSQPTQWPVNPNQPQWEQPTKEEQDLINSLYR